MDWLGPLISAIALVLVAIIEAVATRERKRYKADRERAEYCDSLAEGKWGDAASYDLCLDTRRFGTDGAAALIVAAVRGMEGQGTGKFRL